MNSKQLPRIGFLGAGRVGRGLAFALARAGYPVRAAGSRSRASAEALAALAPGCSVADRGEALIAACDLVFLTVPDDAIAAAAASLPWRAGVIAVHTSGAAELTVLETAKRQGAGVGAFHPLVMFSDPQTAADALAGSTVAIEGEAAVAAVLAPIAHAFGARTMELPASARAAYHAAAHYAAGFVCVLLREAEEIWRSAGIGAAGEAAAALLPLARGALDAIERAGPAAAMQGAAARGDLGTVAKHLQALSGLDPRLLDLYRPLALRAVEIALETGRIDAPRAAELRRLLVP